MCEHSVDAAVMRAIERRSVLKLAAMGAGLVLAGGAFAQEAKAPPKPENVLSPDDALKRLMEVNTRYVQGVSKRHDFNSEREPLRTGQNPFAAVLSCADSRIAPEYCFDAARGDVFVCRVAGNFASDEIVASLEYAVQVLDTPLIMVLGHDACGAVDATAKSIKDGSTLPGQLPALVSAISPAVKAVQNEAGDIIENAIRRNVILNVQKLKTVRPILNAGVDNKKTTRYRRHLQASIRDGRPSGLTIPDRLSTRMPRLRSIEASPTLQFRKGSAVNKICPSRGGEIRWVV